MLLKNLTQASKEGDLLILIYLLNDLPNKTKGKLIIDTINFFSVE